MISFILSSVSGTISKSGKLVLNLNTLSTRNGSSENALDTCLSFLSFISCCPLNGSINDPFSSSAIALIVRSLLSKSSSKVIDGFMLNSKPV